jgi:hypothetical protein
VIFTLLIVLIVGIASGIVFIVWLDSTGRCRHEPLRPGLPPLYYDPETIPRWLEIRERLNRLLPPKKPDHPHQYVRNPLERCE